MVVPPTEDSASNWVAVGEGDTNVLGLGLRGVNAIECESASVPSVLPS